MLFFPKNSRDWTIDILVGVGLIFFIPLFFSLAISNRLVLAFTFFVYVGALFTVYLYLLHKYMLKFAGVNEEVEELRKQIRINNKNKQLMNEPQSRKVRMRRATIWAALMIKSQVFSRLCRIQ